MVREERSNIGMRTSFRPALLLIAAVTIALGSIAHGSNYVNVAVKTKLPKSSEQHVVTEAASDLSMEFAGLPLRDGCDLRAHLQNQRLAKKFGIDSRKIFALPQKDALLRPRDLREVSWRYHVASAVRTNEGWKVIDSSLSRKPLLVGEWLTELSDEPSEIKTVIMDQLQLQPPDIKVQRSRRLKAGDPFRDDVINHMRRELAMITSRPAPSTQVHSRSCTEKQSCPDSTQTRD